MTFPVSDSGIEGKDATAGADTSFLLTDAGCGRESISLKIGDARERTDDRTRNLKSSHESNTMSEPRSSEKGARTANGMLSRWSALDMFKSTVKVRLFNERYGDNGIKGGLKVRSKRVLGARYIKLDLLELRGTHEA